MEKTFFRQIIAESVKDVAAQTENCINGAVEELRKAGFEIDSTEDLRKVSPQWLAKIVDGGLAKFTKNVGFMPTELKKEYENSYKKIEREYSPLCGHIKGWLAKYQGVAVVMDEDGYFQFKDEDIQALAEKQATYHFTEQEQEYYAKLEAVREKIEDLAAFERKQGVNDFSRTIAPRLDGFNEGIFLDWILQGHCLRPANL